MATTLASLRPLTGEPADWDPLIERARGARYVLLGDATHGTHEFYRERAQITKRLIVEGAVRAVAVEADWPHAHRVDRYVRGAGGDADASQALGGFTRFPSWMWRNAVVCEFVEWLRAFNDGLPSGAPKIGFYGLDLLSVRSSIEAVVSYLERVDPPAAARARERYACFDHFDRDPKRYARDTGLAGVESCEQDVVAQLVELRERAAESAGGDEFHAEQNALLVANAELYYRAMFRGGAESWNLRDAHMVQTLEALAAELERTTGRGPAKVVVWAHNSHVGDDRATELAQEGQLNVGQLVRERHGDDALLVGFTTYAGTVTAAPDYGAPAMRMNVRPALRDSWEAVFHEQGPSRFLADARELEGSRLQRAIGVVYRPETERFSHYVQARMGEQFEWLIHIDETTALAPL